MQYTLAVLRRAAIERRMKGDEVARDTAIERFLGELSELFTPRLIQSIDDETIASLYEDWLRSLPHLSFDQRMEALCRDVRLCKVPFLIHRQNLAPNQDAPAEEHSNVVSLHAR